MTTVGSLRIEGSDTALLSDVRWCSRFFCKLRGLMFRRELVAGEGLLMVEPKASRSATAIHMLFMAFPIATIWLDDDFQIVDKVLALPWRLMYAPSEAARYTLEASVEILDAVQIGDRLIFEARND